MPNLILVGSTYFFQNMDGFHSKDKDFIMLMEDPKDFNFVRQTSSTFCLFEWKKMTPQGFIDYALSKGPAMQLGKFLVPEFCNEISFTIEHLKQLQPLTDKLDLKHQYEKLIFDYYILNGSFTLTEEQLNIVYEEYKKERVKVI